MQDEQSDRNRTRDLKIYFEDVPEEVANGLRQWFSDTTNMVVNARGEYKRLRTNYKIDLGVRKGCFPTSIDHRAIHFIVDCIEEQDNTAAIRRLAGM